MFLSPKPRQHPHPQGSSNNTWELTLRCCRRERKIREKKANEIVELNRESTVAIRSPKECSLVLYGNGSAKPSNLERCERQISLMPSRKSKNGKYENTSFPFNWNYEQLATATNNSNSVYVLLCRRCATREKEELQTRKAKPKVGWLHTRQNRVNNVVLLRRCVLISYHWVNKGKCSTAVEEIKERRSTGAKQQQQHKEIEWKLSPSEYRQDGGWKCEWENNARWINCAILQNRKTGSSEGKGRQIW